MTDPAAPEGRPSPVSPVGPTPPAAKKPGGRGAQIIVGLLVVFLAVVLFVVRNNVAAGDLKVGDCFDIPNGTTVRTVQSRPCAESHHAEVIFVGEYDGATYPISLSLDSYVKATCLPAFESYVGRGIDTEPKLAVGFFHPSRDSWDRGDRTITCYAGLPDDSPTTGSLRTK